MENFNVQGGTSGAVILLLIMKEGKQLMKIMPNGDIFIRGELITTDKEIAEAFTVPIIKPESNG